MSVIAQQMHQQESSDNLRRSSILSQQIYDYEMVQNPTIQLGDGSKLLTDINIFLPLRNNTDARRAYKQVKAINGCYQWKISKAEFIELQQFHSQSHPDCSNVAEVSNLQTKESNSVVWLTAKDQSSNTVLTAQIKVAKINRIEIFTRFRQVSTGDQINLVVLAYDNEGNAFSSLDGLRFDWVVISGNQNLRRMPWKDTSHIRAHRQQHIDEQLQDQGDDFVLKALKCGYSEITVKIVEPGYENIDPSSIKLTFVDPFIVKAADASLETDEDEQEITILPVSEFDFKTLLVIKQEDNGIHYEDVKNPDNYQWNISESSKNIGLISQKGKFFSKTKPGTVEIEVTDKKFHTNTAETTINVAEPYQLHLEVADVTNQYNQLQNSFDQRGFGKNMSYQHQLGIKEWDSNWIFVEQRYYLIKAQLYDLEMKKITLTDNILFKLDSNKTFLKTVYINKIGSEILIFVNKLQNETQKAQKTIIKSNLEEIVSKIPNLKYTFNKQKIMMEKEIIITTPVKIQHPTDLILLPQIRGFDGSNIGEIFNLQGSGGSGSYQWEIQDASIAQVQQQAFIRSNQVGKTQLWLRDHKNPKNYAIINVEVQQIQNFEWLEPKIEILIQSNHTFILNAIARDPFGRKFSNCSRLNLDYQVNQDYLKIHDDSHSSWEDLQRYIKQNDISKILILKDHFERNPQAVFSENIKLNVSDINLINYNNFGICDQVKLKSQQNGGLTRVKAQIRMHGTIAESEDAEIAIFQKLQTIGPSYVDYLKDLYSSDQSGQEFQSFMQMIPVSELHNQPLYSIAYGSQFILQLNGGSNFWKNYLGEYQTFWKIQNLNNSANAQNNLEVSFLSQEQTNTSLTIKCLSPLNPQLLKQSADYEIKVFQQSKQSRTLLRPIIHQETIKIHCSTPSKVRLLWSQPPIFENIQETQKPHQIILPSSRLQDNLRKHFVLLDQKYYVRSIMIDDLGFAIFNFDSINLQFTSSNESIAQLAQVQNLNQDFRLAHFNQVTGSVYLQSKAINYKSLFSQIQQQNLEKHVKTSFWGIKTHDDNNQWSQVAHKIISQIQDSLNVEVVKNQVLKPSEKTIYFQGKQNPFIFEIKDGSGYFSVKLNDSSVAELHVTGRQVKIIPKTIGSIEVVVEDIALSESSPAISILHISNIAQLQLHSIGYLIEQNQIMNISVSAKDFYGKKFDIDQYEKMNFELQTEMTGVHKTSDIQISKVQNNNKEFQVMGVEPGSYLITAFIQNELFGEKVTSSAMKIEVFPTLKLYPINLLLTPNMRYTLEVIGGPQLFTSGKSKDGSEVTFALNIKDKNIATIDAFNEISAHQVGDTMLEYQIIHTKESEGQIQKYTISRRTIQIRVRLVTSIEIPENRQRVVFIGSLNKQVVVLKYQNETFSHGIAPISYSWNCSHQTVLKPYLHPENALQSQDQIKQQGRKYHGIKIRNNEINDNQASFTTSFNSSTIYSKAQSQGQAYLSVKIAIDYPNLYKNDKNWFETQALIQVREMLSISVPVFTNEAQETHLYLIPRNAISRIQTNNKNAKLKMGYSLQSVFVNTTNQFEYRESSSPIIELIEGVGIKTLDKYGKVTVILEENQSYGAQLVMLNLLITDIYSIAAENFYEALSLPLGSTIKIPLSFQNENAHLFAKNIEGIKINIKLSHPRVVKAHLDDYNQSLTLTSLNSGECNILIYLEDDPQIYDIFKVKVSTMLQPSSPVFAHIGSQIQFKIVDEDYVYQSSLDPSHKHRWTSSNFQVFEIDQALGKGVSLSEGKTEIKLSNRIQAQSMLQVSKVNQIDLSQNNLMINIDDESDRNIRLRLRVYLKDQDEELMPIYQYEGQNLIKQNVKIDCVSNQTAYLQANGESNDLEGYFCNFKYIGNSNQLLKTPKQIQVSVYASSNSQKDYNSKQSQALQVYKEQLKQFEIKLTSNIHIEKAYKNGVVLTQGKRGKDVQVLSLSEFDIESEDDTVQILEGYFNEGARDQKNTRLLVKKSKESIQSNQFNLTLKVPSHVKESFQTVLILRSKVSGSLVRLAVKFDSQYEVLSSQSQRQSQSQQSDQDQDKSIYETLDASKEQTFTKSGDQASYTSYIIMFFIVIIGCIFIFDQKSLRCIDLLKELLNFILGLLNICTRRRIGDDQDSSRSFYSFMNEQRNRPQYQPSAQRIYNQNQVREKAGQHDYRMREENPRYPGGSFIHRGSVISPQSMQQQQSAHSIYNRVHQSANQEDPSYHY